MSPTQWGANGIDVFAWDCLSLTANSSSVMEVRRCTQEEQVSGDSPDCLCGSSAGETQHEGLQPCTYSCSGGGTYPPW